jgi:hypothetical protein
MWFFLEALHLLETRIEQKKSNRKFDSKYETLRWYRLYLFRFPLLEYGYTRRGCLRLSTLAARTGRRLLCDIPCSMVPSANISVTCSLEAWSATAVPRFVSYIPRAMPYNWSVTTLISNTQTHSYVTAVCSPSVLRLVRMYPLQSRCSYFKLLFLQYGSLCHDCDVSIYLLQSS